MTEIIKQNIHFVKLLTLFALICIISACQKTQEIESAASFDTQLQEQSDSKVLNKSISISNASLPNLFKNSKGKVLLSYVTTKDDVSSLWLVNWEHGNWGEPELVASGDNWFVNWADFPSIVKNSDYYFAHWLEKNGKGTYAYGVRFSMRSLDGEWQEPKWLHTDNSATEHGFVSLQPDKSGVHAVWLDGRNMQVSGHESHDASAKNNPQDAADVEGMTLRYAYVNNQGEIEKRSELDSLTCDCCQTSLVNSGDNVVVAYRDREVINSNIEFRDIKVLHKARSATGHAWKRAINTPSDKWNIQACPVNGPALASQNNTLALAWFSGSHNQAKVQMAFSDDNGVSFSEALKVDNSNNLGRVGLDWISETSVLVTWIGMRDEATVLLYRTINIDGSMGETQIASLIDMSRSSGFPQLKKISDNKALLVWTKTADSPSIQSKIIALN